MALCLIVEDDETHRRVLAATLSAAGHDVVEAGCGVEARRRVEAERPQVVLLDLGLPDVDGLELVPEILTESPFTRVIVLSGRDSVPDAVAALRAGARHYLVKPWDREELLLLTEREARAVDRHEAMARSTGEETYWGGHPGMLEVRASLSRLAASPLTPVLIEGATGTGKEIVARHLHEKTAGAEPFVALNCAAVPGELQENELFGHERGAFTGADRRQRGLVELARGGTLFLDEIGEMSPGLQAKLLRFLEGHRFRRVGGEQEIEAKSRVVAATHRDLDEAVASGGFRQDLFFRLAVVRLHVPTLAERREDLLPLAHFLLSSLCRRLGRPRRPLSPAAETAILDHEWPGNVRELRNRLERALVLGGDPLLEPADLDLASSPHARRFRGNGPDSASIRRILAEEAWVVTRAARRLGVARHWLRYRMQRDGLRRPG